MYCPSCKDQFREGFTRCATCNVDLVHDLSTREGATERSAPQQPMLVRMVQYCGFLSLEDARDARNRLRQEQIRTEIVLREAPGVDWDQPVHEEFWLNVEADRVREVAGLLGSAPTVDTATFSCGACGHLVAETESACPQCGARFEDDG